MQNTAIKWDKDPFFKDVIFGKNSNGEEFNILDTLSDIVKLYCDSCQHCSADTVHTNKICDEIMCIHRAYVEDSNIPLNRFQYKGKDYTDDELIEVFKNNHLEFYVDFIYESGTVEETEIDDGIRYTVDVPEYDNDRLTITLADMFNYAYNAYGITRSVTLEDYKEIHENANKEVAKDIIVFEELQISKLRNEITELRKSFFKPEDQNIRDALSRAASALNSAQKMIQDKKPMEGQMSIFDYLETEDEEMER